MSRSRVWRHVGVLAPAQALALGLNFAVWVHLSRALGPEGFGVVTFGVALLSYFVLAVTLGIDTVGVREVARRAGRVRALVPTVLGVRLALAAGAGLVYAAVVVLLPNPPSERAALAVLGLLLLARAVQVDWAFRGLERMGVVALWQGAVAVLTAAAAFAAVRGPGDLVAATLAVAGVPVVASLGLLAVYRRRVGSVQPRVRWRAWEAVLRPALPLAAAAFVGEVYYNLDKVMLEGLRTTAEVGYYGVGYKVYALAVAPAAVLLPAFFPSLAAADRGAERRRAAAAYGRALIAFGLPLAVAGPVLAGPLVLALFGAEYAAAVPAAQILLVNAGVVYVAMAHGNPLTAWDLERPYMRVVFVGGAVNVALNVALIGPLGTVGAAGATLATEAVVLAGMVVLFRRETGGTHAGALLRTVPVALACGAAAWGATVLDWPVVAWLPLLAAVWAGSLWAFGVVRASEVLEAFGRRAGDPAPS